jgi:hypothetical protein
MCGTESPVLGLRISYTNYSLGPPTFLGDPLQKNCPSEQVSYIFKCTTAF